MTQSEAYLPGLTVLLPKSSHGDRGKDYSNYGVQISQ